MVGKVDTYRAGCLPEASTSIVDSFHELGGMYLGINVKFPISIF